MTIRPMHLLDQKSFATHNVTFHVVKKIANTKAADELRQFLYKRKEEEHTENKGLQNEKFAQQERTTMPLITKTCKITEGNNKCLLHKVMFKCFTIIEQETQKKKENLIFD